MRRIFADTLYDHMKENKDVYLLTADLGFRVWDQHFQDFPDRCINTGAAESTTLDTAVGLAYAGKIPVCYTITPFFYRAFETIRTYIIHEKLHVILVGSGRDKNYEHDGYSHNASDASKIFDVLDFPTYFPKRKEDVPVILEACLRVAVPGFISLRR